MNFKDKKEQLNDSLQLSTELSETHEIYKLLFDNSDSIVKGLKETNFDIQDNKILEVLEYGFDIEMSDSLEENRKFDWFEDDEYERFKKYLNLVFYFDVSDEIIGNKKSVLKHKSFLVYLKSVFIDFEEFLSYSDEMQERISKFKAKVNDSISAEESKSYMSSINLQHEKILSYKNDFFEILPSLKKNDNNDNKEAIMLHQLDNTFTDYKFVYELSETLKNINHSSNIIKDNDLLRILLNSDKFNYFSYKSFFKYFHEDENLHGSILRNMKQMTDTFREKDTTNNKAMYIVMSFIDTFESTYTWEIEYGKFFDNDELVDVFIKYCASSPDNDINTDLYKKLFKKELDRNTFAKKVFKRALSIDLSNELESNDDIHFKNNLLTDNAKFFNSFENIELNTDEILISINDYNIDKNIFLKDESGILYKNDYELILDSIIKKLFEKDESKLTNYSDVHDIFKSLFKQVGFKRMLEFKEKFKTDYSYLFDEFKNNKALRKNFYTYLDWFELNFEEVKATGDYNDIKKLLNFKRFDSFVTYDDLSITVDNFIDLFSYLKTFNLSKDKVEKLFSEIYNVGFIEDGIENSIENIKKIIEFRKTFNEDDTLSYYVNRNDVFDSIEQNIIEEVKLTGSSKTYTEFKETFDSDSYKYNSLLSEMIGKNLLKSTEKQVRSWGSHRSEKTYSINPLLNGHQIDNIKNFLFYDNNIGIKKLNDFKDEFIEANILSEESIQEIALEYIMKFDNLDNFDDIDEDTKYILKHVLKVNGDRNAIFEMDVFLKSNINWSFSKFLSLYTACGECDCNFVDLFVLYYDNYYENLSSEEKTTFFEDSLQIILRSFDRHNYRSNIIEILKSYVDEFKVLPSSYFSKRNGQDFYSYLSKNIIDDESSLSEIKKHSEEKFIEGISRKLEKKEHYSSWNYENLFRDIYKTRFFSLEYIDSLIEEHMDLEVKELFFLQTSKYGFYKSVSFNNIDDNIFAFNVTDTNKKQFHGSLEDNSSIYNGKAQESMLYTYRNNIDKITSGNSFNLSWSEIAQKNHSMFTKIAKENDNYIIYNQPSNLFIDTNNVGTLYSPTLSYTISDKDRSLYSKNLFDSIDKVIGSNDWSQTRIISNFVKLQERGSLDIYDIVNLYESLLENLDRLKNENVDNIILFDGSFLEKVLEKIIDDIDNKKLSKLDADLHMNGLSKTTLDYKAQLVENKGKVTSIFDKSCIVIDNMNPDLYFGQKNATISVNNIDNLKKRMLKDMNKLNKIKEYFDEKYPAIVGDRDLYLIDDILSQFPHIGSYLNGTVTTKQEAEEENIPYLNQEEIQIFKDLIYKAIEKFDSDLSKIEGTKSKIKFIKESSLIKKIFDSNKNFIENIDFRLSQENMDAIVKASIKNIDFEIDFLNKREEEFQENRNYSKKDEYYELPYTINKDILYYLILNNYNFDLSKIKFYSVHEHLNEEFSDENNYNSSQKQILIEDDRISKMFEEPYNKIFKDIGFYGNNKGTHMKSEVSRSVLQSKILEPLQDENMTRLISDFSQNVNINSINKIEDKSERIRVFSNYFQILFNKDITITSRNVFASYINGLKKEDPSTFINLTNKLSDEDLKNIILFIIDNIEELKTYFDGKIYDYLLNLSHIDGEFSHIEKFINIAEEINNSYIESFDFDAKEKIDLFLYLTQITKPTFDEEGKIIDSTRSDLAKVGKFRRFTKEYNTGISVSVSDTNDDDAITITDKYFKFNYIDFINSDFFDSDSDFNFHGVKSNELNELYQSLVISPFEVKYSEQKDEEIEILNERLNNLNDIKLKALDLQTRLDKTKSANNKEKLSKEIAELNLDGIEDEVSEIKVKLDRTFKNWYKSINIKLKLFDLAIIESVNEQSIITNKRNPHLDIIDEDNFSFDVYNKLNDIYMKKINDITFEDFLFIISKSENKHFITSMFVKNDVTDASLVESLIVYGENSDIDLDKSFENLKKFNFQKYFKVKHFFINNLNKGLMDSGSEYDNLKVLNEILIGSNLDMNIIQKWISLINNFNLDVNLFHFFDTKFLFEYPTDDFISYFQRIYKFLLKREVSNLDEEEEIDSKIYYNFKAPLISAVENIKYIEEELGSISVSGEIIYNTVTTKSLSLDSEEMRKDLLYAFESANYNETENISINEETEGNLNNIADTLESKPLILKKNPFMLCKEMFFDKKNNVWVLYENIPVHDTRTFGQGYSTSSCLTMTGLASDILFEMSREVNKWTTTLVSYQKPKLNTSDKRYIKLQSLINDYNSSLIDNKFNTSLQNQIKHLVKDLFYMTGASATWSKDLQGTFDNMETNQKKYVNQNGKDVRINVSEDYVIESINRSADRTIQYNLLRTFKDMLKHFKKQGNFKDFNFKDRPLYFTIGDGYSDVSMNKFDNIKKSEQSFLQTNRTCYTDAKEDQQHLVSKFEHLDISNIEELSSYFDSFKNISFDDNQTLSIEEKIGNEIEKITSSLKKAIIVDTNKVKEICEKKERVKNKNRR